MSNVSNSNQANSLPSVLQQFEAERLQLIQQRDTLLKTKEESLKKVDAYYEPKLREYNKLLEQKQSLKEQILGITKRDIDNINEQLAMCERHINKIAQATGIQLPNNHNINNTSGDNFVNQFNVSQHQHQQQAQQAQQAPQMQPAQSVQSIHSNQSLQSQAQHSNSVHNGPTLESLQHMHPSMQQRIIQSMQQQHVLS